MKFQRIASCPVFYSSGQCPQSISCLLTKDAEGTEPRIPVTAKLLRCHFFQNTQIACQECAKLPAHCRKIVKILRNDILNDPVALHIVRCDMQCLRRIRCTTRILPQNSGTSLGTDDGIDGIFQHIHTVCRRKRKRTAAAARCRKADHGQPMLRQAEASHLCAADTHTALLWSCAPLPLHKRKTSIMPAKAERIGKCQRKRSPDSGIRCIIKIADRIGNLQMDGRRYCVVSQCEDRGDRLRRTRPPKRPPPMYRQRSKPYRPVKSDNGWKKAL